MTPRTATGLNWSQEVLSIPKNLAPEVICTAFTRRVCHKDAASRLTTFRQVEKEQTGQRTEMRNAVCGLIDSALGELENWWWRRWQQMCQISFVFRPESPQISFSHRTFLLHRKAHRDVCWSLRLPLSGAYVFSQEANLPPRSYPTSPAYLIVWITITNASFLVEGDKKPCKTTTPKTFLK